MQIGPHLQSQFMHVRRSLVMLCRFLKENVQIRPIIAQSVSPAKSERISTSPYNLTGTIMSAAESVIGPIIQRPPGSESSKVQSGNQLRRFCLCWEMDNQSTDRGTGKNRLTQALSQSSQSFPLESKRGLGVLHCR